MSDPVPTVGRYSVGGVLVSCGGWSGAEVVTPKVKLCCKLALVYKFDIVTTRLLNLQLLRGYIHCLSIALLTFGKGTHTAGSTSSSRSSDG